MNDRDCRWWGDLLLEKHAEKIVRQDRNTNAEKPKQS